MAREKADLKQNMAAKEAAVPVAEKTEPVPKKTDSTPKETAPAAASHAPAKTAAPAVEKAEPAPKKTDSTSKETAPTAVAPAPAKMAAPVVEKAEPAPKKIDATPKETAPVTAASAPAAPAAEKEEPAPKKTASTAKKTTSTAKKTPSTGKKTAAASKETAPAAADPTPEAAVAPVAEQEEPVKKTASTKKKTASTGKKTASAEKKTASATKKKTPAPEEHAPAVEEAAPVVQETAPAQEEAAPVVEEAAPMFEMSNLPRRSVAFIGSECHPFVKTGGLGDVMYALPRELVRLKCDVRGILPRYGCIPQEYQNKMVYRGAFYMDLGRTGRNYYVGIMEYIWDGVVYDFIDNQEFFTGGNPYTNLVDDIPKYCFFSKAALAALNYMNWIPDIVHCHDWQAALVPVYLRTLFKDSPVGHAKSVLTIHNLRFQGVYNIPTIRYWSGLPDEVFNMGALQQNWVDANMLKGGLAYADRITTVSGTYAGEIQTSEYGEHLENHLRYHNYKLRGIVNGIDYGMWNPETDPALAHNYSLGNVLDHKMENKLALQKELGLEQDTSKFVIGLISRLTNQKGLDLVNAIMTQVLDGNTQVVVLGTGDRQYEDAFRYYENTYRGTFSACIQYDEGRAHRIYAGATSCWCPPALSPVA